MPRTKCRYTACRSVVSLTRGDEASVSSCRYFRSMSPRLRLPSLIAFALVAAVVSAVACTHRASTTTVFLGAAAPLSSAVGDANMKGFELALDELNATPGHSFKFDKVI